MIQEIIEPIEFLERTEELRRANPFGTNQIASIAIGMVQGKRQSGEMIRFWISQSSEVTACATLNPARGFFMSPSTSVEEAHDFGSILSNSHAAILPEVTGTTSAVEAFNNSYCKNRQPLLQAVWKEDLLLYALTKLIVPTTVDGSLRFANDNDADKKLLIHWAERFFEYIDLPVTGAEGFILRALPARALVIWQVEGSPVGFAGFAPPVELGNETVFRIGPVYVHDEYRRKGYASAMTAALSKQLMQDCPNTARICLYADAANPASNKAYQNVGFEFHSKACAYGFKEV